MKMNLPNKLTLLRIIMVPFTVAVMLLWGTDWSAWIAAVLFILASVTDLLDGIIARSRHLVTDFGKFMDPLADKLLVCSVILVLVVQNRCHVVIAIIIIARELAVSGFRSIAAGKGVVLAADKFGKRKANFQTAWLIGELVPFHWTWWTILTQICMWIAVVLTVLSFVNYMVKNKEVLREK